MEALFALLLADLEDALLGVIEEIAGGAAPVVRFADEVCGRLDQSTDQRLFANDARVVVDVRRRRHRVEEKGEVLLSAGGVEVASERELVGERERIDNGATFAEGDDRAENPPMCLSKEHGVVGVLRGAKNRVAVHDHRAEYCLFRVLRPYRPAVAVRVNY